MLKFERNNTRMGDFIRFIRAPLFHDATSIKRFSSCISSSLWTRRISFDINVRSTPINNEIALTWIIPPTDTFLIDHTEETKTENQKPQYFTSKTSHIRIYVHIGTWDINPSDCNHKHEHFVRVVPILKDLILSLHDIEQYRTIPNDN